MDILQEITRHSVNNGRNLHLFLNHPLDDSFHGFLYLHISYHRSRMFALSANTPDDTGRNLNEVGKPLLHGQKVFTL